MNKETKIVLIGGSLGSSQIIIDLLKTLDFKVKAPLFLVIHRAKTIGSGLAKAFSSYGANIVVEIENFEKIENKIYLVPPDHHLLVDENGRLILDFSEKISYSRPSIDVTFESFSAIYKDRIMGIILSGANYDGASGAWQIVERGGSVLVQNPENAEARSMPEAAIQLVDKNVRILDTEKLINEIKNHLI